jgi:hypothetical protein
VRADSWLIPCLPNGLVVVGPSYSLVRGFILLDGLKIGNLGDCFTSVAHARGGDVVGKSQNLAISLIIFKGRANHRGVEPPLVPPSLRPWGDPVVPTITCPTSILTGQLDEEPCP